MKRTLIFLFLVFCALVAFSQEINNFGHITDYRNAVSCQNSRQSAQNIHELLFDERVFAQAGDKQITITTLEQNVSSILRVYTWEHRPILEQTFSQIINPELSPDSVCLSFYCKGELVFTESPNPEIRNI